MVNVQICGIYRHLFVLFYFIFYQSIDHKDLPSVILETHFLQYLDQLHQIMIKTWIFSVCAYLYVMKCPTPYTEHVYSKAQYEILRGCKKYVPYKLGAGGANGKDPKTYGPRIPVEVVKSNKRSTLCK